MSDWISVDDRLPEEGVRVLLYHEGSIFLSRLAN